ncbi:MAG: RNA polymerase sigma factor SigZ [Candidatus Kapaibacteriales bacterium]
MTDEDLIKLYLEGGEQKKSKTFSLIYDRLSGALKSYCDFLVGASQESDDIFQECFIILHKKLESGQLIENPKAYLHMVAKNMARNKWRDKKVFVEVAPEDFSFDMTADMAKDEMLGLIESGLQLLDSKYREAFVLREYSGMKFEEIASVLDLSLSGAKTRVLRAHEKLVKILRPYIDEMKINVK